MSNPYIGEILWTKNGEQVKVVHIEGTAVWVVPAWVLVTGLHQGNLYDDDGKRKYMV